MTDLRKAANTALYALETNYPLIEDYGNKEQLDIHHEAIMDLYKALTQPDETETLKRCLFQMQEAAKVLAQSDNQKFVAWLYNGHLHECDPSYWAESEVKPLYTAPPKREWVGLTSEDWENTPDTGKQGCERDAELFDWIEKTLKDKNT